MLTRQADSGTEHREMAERWEQCEVRERQGNIARGSFPVHIVHIRLVFFGPVGNQEYDLKQQWDEVISVIATSGWKLINAQHSTDGYRTGYYQRTVEPNRPTDDTIVRFRLFQSDEPR